MNYESSGRADSWTTCETLSIIEIFRSNASQARSTIRASLTGSLASYTVCSVCVSWGLCILTITVTYIIEKILSSYATWTLIQWCTWSTKTNIAINTSTSASKSSLNERARRITRIWIEE